MENSARTTNEEIIRRLRMGPKEEIARLVQHLHQRLTRCALKYTETMAVSDMTITNNIEKLIVLFLTKFPEETLQELRRVFEGFQLMLQYRGDTYAWRLQWTTNPPGTTKLQPEHSNPPPDRETILVAFSETETKEKPNKEIIEKLCIGPRRKIPYHVRQLHEDITCGAQQAVKTVGECSTFELANQSWDHYFLFDLFNAFPEETREELQRVFCGFRLLLRTNGHDPTWILQWNPTPYENEEVLVEFPS